MVYMIYCIINKAVKLINLFVSIWICKYYSQRDGVYIMKIVKIIMAGLLISGLGNNIYAVNPLVP